jgi:hypothetical protein
MRPRSERRIIVPAILVSLLLGAPGKASASPDDRKTLVLRGRVTDEQGWPVGGARVIAQGTRRVRSTADDAGQFFLTVPLGSLADLARKPIVVRVCAERRGWRLALPGNEAELGFELRTSAGEDGVARCEVRSNQSKVVSAIVRALTTDGDATGVAVVNFIGARGEMIGSPAPPELAVAESVALAGVRVAMVPPPKAEPSRAKRQGAVAAEAGGAKAAKTEGAKAAKTEGANPKRSESPPRREPVRAEQPVTATPARPGPAVVTPRPSEAERALIEAKRRAEQERSLAREEAKRLREETRERDRLARLARAEEKSHAMEEEKALRAAEEELKHGRRGQQDRWDALRREVHLFSGTYDTTSAPPVAALDRLAGAPSHVEQRDRVLSSPRLSPRRDTVAVRPPQELPEPPPPAVRTPTPAVSGGPVASPVFPRPAGEPRARARPLVIRTPGLQPVAAAPPAAVGDSCSCRIEGTVEVDSDRPLPGRMRVAISLGWYPAIADTVELFMGSPRAFSLPAAPCGPQRLRLVNLGALRFDVSSREAMAGFHCVAGALRQFRVVLTPR